MWNFYLFHFHQFIDWACFLSVSFFFYSFILTKKWVDTWQASRSYIGNTCCELLVDRFASKLVYWSILHAASSGPVVATGGTLCTVANLLVADSKVVSSFECDCSQPWCPVSPGQGTYGQIWEIWKRGKYFFAHELNFLVFVMLTCFNYAH